MRENKKEKVLDFIKRQGRVKTHEVIAFGLEIYHNRALRDAQEHVQAGKIFRLHPARKKMMYGDIGEDVFTSNVADTFAPHEKENNLVEETAGA